MNRVAASALTAASLMLTVLAACDGARPGSPALGNQRTPVRMTASEREHLRHGMRTYLESTEGIVDALAGNKMSAVADHARKAGTSTLRGVPLWSALTLPPEFVLLGADTHQKFDALSQAAAGKASKREVLQLLQGILANCTACHNTFRIAPSQR